MATRREESNSQIWSEEVRRGKRTRIRLVWRKGMRGSNGMPWCEPIFDGGRDYVFESKVKRGGDVADVGREGKRV